jgi:hypothetical protein
MSVVTPLLSLAEAFLVSSGENKLFFHPASWALFQAFRVFKGMCQASLDVCRWVV